MKYITRALESRLRQEFHDCKSVLLTGARQVGKSTLLKKLFPDCKYVSLDDPFLEQQARENANLFMMLNPPPLMIDEIQHAPELFRYLKLKCDETDERGLFCLSGTQQFRLMKNVSETPSGRIAILELGGLSLREIQCDPFSRYFLPTMEYVRERQKTAQPPGQYLESHPSRLLSGTPEYGTGLGGVLLQLCKDLSGTGRARTFSSAGS